MRKHLIHSVLLIGLACSSGWAQDVDFFARSPLLYLDLRHEDFESNPVLTSKARHACATNWGRGIPKQRAAACSSIRSMWDLIAWSDDGPSFNDAPIARSPDGRAVFFISGMTIDADGAPNAYHPNNDGLDEVANAGEPGHWNGIVTDQDGTPLIQHENDPFPGFYVSCTSLFDNNKMFTDPTTYVDSARIPYIALPEELSEREGMRLGDFALVVNFENGKWSYAIYADFGTVGEGSIALADALGISSNARQGGQSEGILYVLFPGSGNRRPRPITEIQIEGERLLSLVGKMRETFFPAGRADLNLGSQ